MATREVSACLVAGMFAIASCAFDPADELAHDDVGELGEGDELASSTSFLVKGQLGATNGDRDYCNDTLNPCLSGEGDCDSDAQCSGGAVCVANNGAKFGFPGNWDICAPAHCRNGQIDAGDGETSMDCGGPCGTCINCVAPSGGNSFCRGCLCAAGEGDCDATSECQAGLVCAANNGLNFGLASDYDVCVPPHCTNRVLDAGDGETSIDAGGPCGVGNQACTGDMSKSFCVGCSCASGEGDCDSDFECATGLTCATDNGPKFSLPSGYDVCVPAHCTNGSLDAASGETSIDAGGPCGTDTNVPSLNVFFSEYVEGSGLHHHLEIYNAGRDLQLCTVNLYLSGSVTPIAIPLNAAIAPQTTFVLCRSGAGLGSPPCSQSVASMVFSGDDAVELVCNGQTQDIIGQIGLDPGAEWGAGLTSTADNTLRRKCSVTTGDKIGSDAFNPALEWDGFATNTFGDLRNRVCP